jgi:hypothetical protein
MHPDGWESRQGDSPFFCPGNGGVEVRGSRGAGVGVPGSGRPGSLVLFQGNNE